MRIVVPLLWLSGLAWFVAGLVSDDTLSLATGTIVWTILAATGIIENAVRVKSGDIP
jgi:hypothetical protein